MMIEGIDYYLDENYETHIVGYIGDIKKAFEGLDYASIIESESFYSVISVRRGMLPALFKAVPEIVNVEKNHIYSLSKIERVDSPYDNKAIVKDGVTLTGEGVIVGIVSTGIDYLSPRFQGENGESRILSIWDQTIKSGPSPSSLSLGYGTEFTKSMINEAIKTSGLERDPYEVVPHRDELGHGTAVAGIVGGRNFGVDDDLISLAPSCEFVIVKLKEPKKVNLELNGITEATEGIYEGADIGFAIKYLAQLQLQFKKPMVVYLPLGTNCSGHDGQSALERYVGFYERQRGFIVVTDNGDEGNSDTHASGELGKVGETKTVDLSVDEKEKNFCLSIWISRPSKVSIGVVAPSGETIEKLPLVPIEEGQGIVSLNSIKVIVQSGIQEETGGEQVILISATGNIGGVWQILITSDYVINGKYNCWILQRKLLKENTRFLKSDPYTTLTTPGTGVSVLTTSYYNQRNNNIVVEAGKGYTRDGRIKPGVTSPGVDLLTVGQNNAMIVTRGAAVGGAYLAGAVALLLQWGIVQGNDRDLFTAKVGTYIIRGAKRVEGVTFPNREWGYGMLSITRLFQVLNQITAEKNNQREVIICEKEKNRGIYVSIPKEIYRRLT